MLKLRYRVSTLLLLITLCGAVLGWIKSRIDADAALANAASEFDRMRGGVRIEAEVSRVVYLCRVLHKQDNSAIQQNEDLQRELCYSMWALHWYESRIDLAYPGDYYAIKHARRILKLLECTTAEEYFSRGRDIYKEPDDWPEYFDTQSQEYIELRDFVDRSLSASSVSGE